MLLALVYSMLRLLLDLVDVRLRVHDCEAELLLLAAPTSRRAPPGQAASVDHRGPDDHGGTEPADEPCGAGRDACPTGDGSWLAPRVSEEKVGGLRSAAWPS